MGIGEEFKSLHKFTHSHVQGAQYIKMMAFVARVYIGMALCGYESFDEIKGGGESLKQKCFDYFRLIENEPQSRKRRRSKNSDTEQEGTEAVGSAAKRSKSGQRDSETANNPDPMRLDYVAGRTVDGDPTMLLANNRTNQSIGQVAETSESVSDKTGAALRGSGNEDSVQCNAAEDTSVQECSRDAGIIDDTTADAGDNSTFAIACRDFNEYCIELGEFSKQARKEYVWLDTEVKFWHKKYRHALRLANPLSDDVNDESPYDDDYEPYDNARVPDEIVETTDDDELRFIKGHVSYILKHKRQRAVLDAKNDQLEAKLNEWKQKYEAVKQAASRSPQLLKRILDSEAKHNLA